MVSWVWIIPTFMFGARFGCLITAVLTADEHDRNND